MDILLAAAESLHRDEMNKVHVRSGKIQKVHVKRKRGIFRCEKCASVFGLRHNLLRHERTIHEGRRPFKCPVPGCLASFVQRFDLQTHAASVHDKRKDFVCSICARAFSQRSNLLTHLRAAHATVVIDPEAEADRVVSSLTSSSSSSPSTTRRKLVRPSHTSNPKLHSSPHAAVVVDVRPAPGAPNHLQTVAPSLTSLPPSTDRTPSSH